MPPIHSHVTCHSAEDAETLIYTARNCCLAFIDESSSTVRSSAFTTSIESGAARALTEIKGMGKSLQSTNMICMRAKQLSANLCSRHIEDMKFLEPDENGRKKLDQKKAQFLTDLAKYQTTRFPIREGLTSCLKKEMAEEMPGILSSFLEQKKVVKAMVDSFAGKEEYVSQIDAKVMQIVEKSDLRAKSSALQIAIEKTANIEEERKRGIGSQITHDRLLNQILIKVLRKCDRDHENPTISFPESRLVLSRCLVDKFVDKFGGVPSALYVVDKAVAAFANQEKNWMGVEMGVITLLDDSPGMARVPQAVRDEIEGSLIEALKACSIGEIEDITQVNEK